MIMAAAMAVTNNQTPSMTLSKMNACLLAWTIRSQQQVAYTRSKSSLSSPLRFQVIFSVMDMFTFARNVTIMVRILVAIKMPSPKSHKLRIDSTGSVFVSGHKSSNLSG